MKTIPPPKVLNSDCDNQQDLKAQVLKTLDAMYKEICKKENVKAAKQKKQTRKKDENH